MITISHSLHLNKVYYAIHDYLVGEVGEEVEFVKHVEIGKEKFGVVISDTYRGKVFVANKHLLFVYMLIVYTLIIFVRMEVLR